MHSGHIKKIEDLRNAIEETEKKYAESIEAREPLDVIKTILGHLHILEKQLAVLTNKK